MNIGIITFHCSYNFGSAIQTFALRRQLEIMGNTAHVIDYRGVDFEQYRLLRLGSARALASSVVSLSKNRRRSKSFEYFFQNYFSMTRRFTVDSQSELEGLRDDFDCFVCGSDQIWNLDCTGGPVGPYFLDFAGDRKRVAYAPSLAHASFAPENFTEHDREFIGEQLDRFGAISVREASTVGLFQPLTENKIDVCLDPTLLLGGEDYRGVIAPAPVEGPFVFAYMLEENPAVMRQAEHVAHEAGARVAYVFRRGRRLSAPSVNLYGVGPSEFLCLVKSAEAVVTNSFHATVFSLIFGTPFQTIATRSSGSRMRELLETLGEAHHLIEGDTGEMPQAANQDALTDKLNGLRAHSLAFLDRALAE